MPPAASSRATARRSAGSSSHASRRRLRASSASAPPPRPPPAWPRPGTGRPTPARPRTATRSRSAAARPRPGGARPRGPAARARRTRRQARARHHHPPGVQARAASPAVRIGVPEREPLGLFRLNLAGAAWRQQCCDYSTREGVPPRPRVRPPAGVSGCRLAALAVMPGSRRQAVSRRRGRALAPLQPAARCGLRAGDGRVARRAQRHQPGVVLLAPAAHVVNLVGRGAAGPAAVPVACQDARTGPPATLAA